MEARIVEQLVSIKPRVTAATGSGIFAGWCHAGGVCVCFTTSLRSVSNIARYLLDMQALQRPCAAARGLRAPAGLSIILARLLAQLPDAVPSTAQECKAVLAASREPMQFLQQMLAAAALSLADALLDR